MNNHSRSPRPVASQLPVVHSRPDPAHTRTLPTRSLALRASLGGTPETNPIYWAGYCNAGKPGSFILTTIVPVSISAFWDTVGVGLDLELDRRASAHRARPDSHSRYALRSLVR